MLNIDIKQAGQCFSDLIEQSEKGDEIIITRKGKPIVRLIAVSAKQKKKRLFGSAKDYIKIADDFDKPLEDFKDYM